MTAPLSRATFVGGKLLGTYTLAAVQILLLLLLRIPFHFDLGSPVDLGDSELKNFITDRCRLTGCQNQTGVWNCQAEYGYHAGKIFVTNKPLFFILYIRSLLQPWK